MSRPRLKPSVRTTHETVYVVLGWMRKGSEVSAGPRFGVVPGSNSFIALEPSRPPFRSQIHEPASVSCQDHSAGRVDPTSKEALGARLTGLASTSRRRKPE